MANNVVVKPARSLQGALRLPGDKSISHRYAMLAAIARGTSRFINFATGDDCARTLGCLQSLGVTLRKADDVLEIDGGTFVAPMRPLDCGNSGSTMRMLAGLLAAQPFASELGGDESLRRRPMDRVAEPLRRMGASVSTSGEGTAPLRIHGAELHGIHYRQSVPSAQVKTTVLFAGLFAAGETTVEEPIRTRDHTELALRAFGVPPRRDRLRVTVEGKQQLQAIEATIPGDISSAAYFLAASALLPAANLVLEGVLLNPTRAGILDVLAGMGARVRFISVAEQHHELVGTVKVEHAPLRGAVISGQQAAQMMDELPLLAAIAPYTAEGVEVRDAAELRVKESDRIRAVAENLRRMSARVEERPDGWRIPGNQALRGAEVTSAGDHRIAMAFAVAALRADGETTIHGAEDVAVSFPEFFELLEQVAER